MEKDKTFDAVQTMRAVREQLSEKYWQHPDLLKKEMNAIKEKYDLPIPSLQEAKTTGL